MAFLPLVLAALLLCGCRVDTLQSAQGPQASRAPLCLAHMRFAVPEVHAVGQGRAAATRTASGDSLGLALPGVEEGTPVLKPPPVAEGDTGLLPPDSGVVVIGGDSGAIGASGVIGAAMAEGAAGWGETVAGLVIGGSGVVTDAPVPDLDWATALDAHRVAAAAMERRAANSCRMASPWCGSSGRGNGKREYARAVPHRWVEAADAGRIEPPR